jgi:glycosyltransferase involved in cell wall biosynthesis
MRRAFGRKATDWLTATLREERATVVHLHTFGSQVIGTRAARAKGARVVRTEHSTRVYNDPSCWPFSRWSLRRASSVVCISEHVERVAVAKAPWAASKMRVVPNGVDVERFAPAPYPEPSPRTRFVIVGRLEPRKGVDVALAALADVPNAELEIVGEGESRAELERLAATIGVGGRARFTGFTPDVRGAIARAELALSSSRAEGLGIALLEAMAMERAVVALPTGGVPEIVAERTGWLARDGSAAALADAMRRACADRAERRERGLRARRHVVDRFSTRAMRQGYEVAYCGLVAGDSR